MNALLTAALLWTLLIPGLASDSSHGPAPTYLACNKAPALPLTVRIAPGVDATTWRAAIAEWNQHYPDTFREVAAGEDATIEPFGGSMWVSMGTCLGGRSVIHADDQAYWYPHELGHLLGLADHIRAGDDASKYIGAQRCPDDGYDGIMSYCSGRSAWFGAGDDEMMRAVFGAQKP